MYFQLTDEQVMILDSLKSFMEQEIYPHEMATDRAGMVPQELSTHIRQKAIEAGFFAMNLPESVGGGGLGYSTMGLIERELGKSTWALTGNIGRPTELLLACAGQQIERYLDPCVRAEKHECFALTEPGAGSDIMAMKTRAVADGDDYIINGYKHFISAHIPPDFAIVFAVTGVDETPRGQRKRVTAFLADVGEPGFEMTLGPQCISQRAYRTYQLSFTDVRVNKSQVLGEEGKGLELADKWLKMGRVYVGAQCCGKMERLLGLATEWAATRTQFGKTIGSFQGTSFKLADMATELRAADLLVAHACHKAEHGSMTPQDAAMAKLFAAEALGRAADNTVQIYGGTGLMEDLVVERLWRDARLDRIWDGTSEIQRHIISRTLLREYES